MYAGGLLLVAAGVLLILRGQLLLGGLLSGVITGLFVVHAATSMPLFVSRSLDLLEQHAATMTAEDIDDEITFIVRQSGGAPSAVTQMRMEEIQAMARSRDAALDE